MSKLIIILSLLVLPSITYSQFENECYLKLTNDYEYDSISFFREAGEHDRDYGKDYLGYSYFIIRDVLKDLGCTKSSINFGKGPKGRSKSLCRRIIPGINTSLSCYIESNLGYFFVSWDQLDNSNVTFNRWD